MNANWMRYRVVNGAPASRPGALDGMVRFAPGPEAGAPFHQRSLAVLSIRISFYPRLESGSLAAMKKFATVTVIGRDKTGVIARVTNFLFDQHANIEAL